MKTALIFLSGGKGLRMASATPKQYLSLRGKPIVLHSLKVFQSIPEIEEIVIVCSSGYSSVFGKDFTFALPGERRQDSVWNGLQKVSREAKLICIHDGARPFIQKKEILEVLKCARQQGASALGTPVPYTIKKCDSTKKVEATLDRNSLWQMQTPQVIRKDLLEEGFSIAQKNNLTVTDDIALAELANGSVQVVPGSVKNLKITTPLDLEFAEMIYEKTI